MNIMLTSLMAATMAVAPDGDESGQISVDSVFLTLLEEVDVPAREAGIVEELLPREGQSVRQDQLLARIDDTQARIAHEQARIELEKARKLASNDLKIQLGEKAHQVARIEFQRALDANQRVPKSVSQTELDRLRLAVEAAELEIEQARFDHATAQLTLRSKQNDLAGAEHNLQRRRVTAPISGFVVELERSRGEWVEPGQALLRLVRLDRLRAEGFVDAQDVTGSLMGRPVELTVSLGDDRTEQFTGVVSFVSPEVSPVNGRVRMWADIDNRSLLLRPGLPAQMTISP